MCYYTHSLLGMESQHYILWVHMGLKQYATQPQASTYLWDTPFQITRPQRASFFPTRHTEVSFRFWWLWEVYVNLSTIRLEWCFSCSLFRSFLGGNHSASKVLNHISGLQFPFTIGCGRNAPGSSRRLFKMTQTQFIPNKTPFIQTYRKKKQHKNKTPKPPTRKTLPPHK